MTDDDALLLRCRHCGVVHDLLCCDVAGADDGCVFCPSCRRQTEADGEEIEELPLLREAAP